MGGNSDPVAGLAAGVDMAMQAETDAPEPVAAQGLFGVLVADADGVGAARESRGGPGRPPGSRNKKSEDWARYIQTRYRSPLIFLAETMSADLATLAATLAVHPVEAFRLQLAAAEKLAPYIHEKRPQALDVGGGNLLTLVINSGGGASSGPTVTVEPVKENQGLSDNDDSMSLSPDGEEVIK